MKTKDLSISGVRFIYSITKHSASKTPIIFINGAFQNRHSWSTIQSILSEHTTTIVTDLPGWGEADALAQEHTFEFHADAINQILESENIPKVIAVSTSFGTPVAIAFAKKYKPKIEQMVLTAPLLEISHQLKMLYPRLQELIVQKDSEKLFRLLLEIGLLNIAEGEKGNIKNFDLIKACFEKQINRLSEKKWTHFINNTERILTYGQSEINLSKGIKTSVIAGEFDSFTDPSTCRNIAEQFDEADFTIIPATDHFFLFERPVYCAKLILNTIGQAENKKMLPSSMIRA